jgi:galactan 5-O-arabinofuranosyltransferase
MGIRRGWLAVRRAVHLLGESWQSRTAGSPVALLSLGRVLAELALGGGVAILVSVLLQAAANRIRVGTGTYVPDALASLSSAVTLLALFGLLGVGARGRWRPWLKLAGTWVALSALATVVLAIPLQATKFFLGGSTIDNAFRLQYMERVSATTSLVDVNYRDLPPFYPAGWFWLGGRFANLFQVPGWILYKPYSITWTALTAVIAFVLWSLVLRRNRALLAAVATVLAGFVAVAPEEPYAWPTTAWLPPLALLAWRVFRRSRTPAWPMVLIGTYLGVCAVSYTLHLAFGLVVVVVLGALAGWRDARAAAAFGPVARRVGLRVGLIGVIGIGLGLITWWPFIRAGGLGKPNLAMSFLPELGAYFPTPFVPDSLFGLLCLAGLAWLPPRCFQRASRSGWETGKDPAIVLAVITTLAYLWFALSTVALYAHTTLLAFRFVATVNVTLAVAGVFAAADLFRALPRVLGAHGSTRSIRALGLVVALAGTVAIAQTSVASSLKGVTNNAESDYYPDGFNARGERDLAQDGAWTGDLIASINQLSGRPPLDTIVLSTDSQLFSFAPYAGFQQSTPQYANPLADYYQRNAEIHHWATSFDANDLLTRLAHNPHRPPNVFVLRRSGNAPSGKLSLRVTWNSFPRAAPLRVEEVQFDQRLFDSPRFASREVGPFVVIVER